MPNNTLTVTQPTGEESFRQPSDEIIARELATLTTDPSSFAILQRDDWHYIQIAQSASGHFYVDYRDGEDATNLFVEKQSFQSALRIILSYANGRDFTVGLTWHSIDNGGVETFNDAANERAFEAGLAGEFSRSFEFNDTNDPAQVKGYIGYHGLAEWWLNDFSAAERHEIEEADYERNEDFDEILFEEWETGISAENSPANNEDDVDWELVELAKSGQLEDTEITSSNASLTQGIVGFSSSNNGEFLAGIAGMMNQSNSRHLALRIADKAKTLLDASRQVSLEPKAATALHFAYRQLMGVYYRSREEVSGALEKAIACAEDMIAVAPGVMVDPEMQVNGLPAHDGYKQLSIIREKQGDLAEAIRISRQALEQGWSGDWEQRIERYEKKLAKLNK